MKRKTTFAIVFIMLYGIALVKPAFPILEYYLNTSAYLERCMNKTRPEMQCKGQCVIMQKLRVFNAESQAPLPPAPVKVNLQDYPIGFIETLHLKCTTEEKKHRKDCRYHRTIRSAYISEVFRPPVSAA